MLKPFWFEANQAWGKKKADKNYLPNFGLYTYDEHKSQLTLEEWAKNNNMYDLLI